MKDNVEKTIYTLLFLWLCVKETVLNTPWMLFVLGGICAIAGVYLFHIS